MGEKGAVRFAANPSELGCKPLVRGDLGRSFVSETAIRSTSFNSGLDREAGPNFSMPHQRNGGGRFAAVLKTICSIELGIALVRDNALEQTCFTFRKLSSREFSHARNLIAIYTGSIDPAVCRCVSEQIHWPTRGGPRDR